MSMHTDRDRLKPCPFCGGEADVEYTFGCDGSWGHERRPAEASVECMTTDCEAIGPVRRVSHAEGDAPGIAREQAIEAWNRRAE